MAVEQLRAKSPETTTDHKSLTAALIAAQLEFGPVEKTTTGARAKYAPLDAVIDTVRPVLNRHGVAIVQMTSVQEDMLVVLTVLRHTSGEEITGVYPVCQLGKAPQDTGSALTYARRYALLGMCGVHPTDEDDDGEKGAGAAGRAPPPPKADAKVAELMERTLAMTETQDDLAAWLGSHKENMAKVDGPTRQKLRDAYAKLLKTLPRDTDISPEGAEFQ